MLPSLDVIWQRARDPNFFLTSSQMLPSRFRSITPPPSTISTKLLVPPPDDEEVTQHGDLIYIALCAYCCHQIYKGKKSENSAQILGNRIAILFAISVHRVVLPSMADRVYYHTNISPNTHTKKRERNGNKRASQE